MAKSRKGRHQIPIELRCVIIACRLLYNSPYNEIERKIGVNANAARNIVNRALERAGNNDLHDVLACVGGADRSDRPRRSSENSETSHDTREATPKTTIDTEGASPSPEELPADKITYDAFKMFLSVVPESVPKKNQELEELRHHTIPEVLANRKKDGDAFLEKTEVQSLIEWKLKFGTYRPNLANLVASNPAEDVRQTTSSGFSTFSSQDTPNPAKAITTLSKLRGIGPASASLMLACYDPVTIPFFSDELFRWLHWEIKNDTHTNDDRKRKFESEVQSFRCKINYTAKEYAAVFEKTTALRERLSEESGEEVKAVDVEKAAYAIAKSIEKRIVAEKPSSPPPKKSRKKA